MLCAVASLLLLSCLHVVTAATAAELVCACVLSRALRNKLGYILACIGFLTLWRNLCPTENSQHAK